jgi:hypothetical protein
MKLSAGLIFTSGCLASTLLAQSPVTVTVDTSATPIPIAQDFSGLSFETSNVLPDKQRKYLFSADSRQLISLFKTLGIKNLRIGGGTAEIAKYAVPGPRDIDQLFAFARAAEVKVIYTLRLLNGDPGNAATIAKYIEDHYQGQLVCFAIGNEPDWHSYHVQDPKITDYPSWLSRWREFAQAIRDLAPGARIGGPDTGSDFPIPKAIDTWVGAESWTSRFADDVNGAKNVAEVFQHSYVGQGAKGVSAPEAIDAMLSSEWPEKNYPALYDEVLTKIDGLPYRLTECNDYTGGVDGASNAYASALWALDYMHWQAAHHAAGVNFHNKRWINTDTIYPDKAGNFQVHAKAYGIKAFELGSHGGEEPVMISNGTNLTAYAVRGEQKLFVTLISKAHGANAQPVDVTITAPGMSGPVEAVYLKAPGTDLSVKAGVTLGGATLGNDGPWRGQWTPLNSDKTGSCAVTVAAASAAVVAIAIN